MSAHSDWCPSTRQGQIDLGKSWITVFGQDTKNSQGQIIKKWEAYEIPQERYTNFVTLWDNANGAFEAGKRAGMKGGEENAIIKAAFDLYRPGMRDLRRRHFFMPPITPEDWIALGEKIPDTTHTPGRPPEAQALVIVKLLGPGRLELFAEIVNPEQFNPRADTRFHIYYGIMPPGGATLEEAAGEHHFLMKEPLLGPELPKDFAATQRRRIKVDLSRFSGMKGFFAVRLENAKGESGPWGAVTSSYIP